MNSQLFFSYGCWMLYDMEECQPLKANILYNSCHFYYYATACCLACTHIFPKLISKAFFQHLAKGDLL